MVVTKTEFNNALKEINIAFANLQKQIDALKETKPEVKASASRQTKAKA